MPQFPYDDWRDDNDVDRGRFDWLYMVAIVLICVAVWVAAVAGAFVLLEWN